MFSGTANRASAAADSVNCSAVKHIPHSARRAVTGSTCVARRAGR
jgi:hypothetical protein